MWIDKSRLGKRARLALLLLLMAVVASGCGASPPVVGQPLPWPARRAPRRGSSM